MVGLRLKVESRSRPGTWWTVDLEVSPEGELLHSCECEDHLFGGPERRGAPWCWHVGQALRDAAEVLPEFAVFASPAPAVDLEDVGQEDEPAAGAPTSHAGPVCSGCGPTGFAHLVPWEGLNICAVCYQRRTGREAPAVFRRPYVPSPPPFDPDNPPATWPPPEPTRPLHAWDALMPDEPAVVREARALTSELMFAGVGPRRSVRVAEYARLLEAKLRDYQVAVLAGREPALVVLGEVVREARAALEATGGVR